MEPAHQSRIPTLSHEQSREWGLVLLSQGINGTISDGIEGVDSGLIVATADYPAAMRAIRLYRKENRRWNWQKPLVDHGFLFDWKVCYWAGLLAAVYVLTHQWRKEFLVLGLVDTSAVHNGEWWRIFTAILLHADLGHLASNLSAGILLLGLGMGRFGGGIGLTLAYLAGVAGNLAGLFLYLQPHSSLGASGMVMGGLGMLAAQSFSMLHFISREQSSRSLMAGTLLFVLFGLSPGTDFVAHFIGFVSGLVLGGVWLMTPSKWQNSKVNLVAAVLLCVWIFMTSCLAFGIIQPRAH